MDRTKVKANCNTGFLYCPRCGLRIPRSEMLVCYLRCCPACGSKMVEEGPIPYSSKKIHSPANHILYFR